MSDLIELRINLIVIELEASIKTLATKSDMTNDDILELKRLFYEVGEARSYIPYRLQMGNLKHALTLIGDISNNINSVSRAVHIIYIFKYTIDILNKIMRIESLYDNLSNMSTVRKLYTVLFDRATTFMQNINNNTVSFIQLNTHPEIQQELLAAINEVLIVSQPYLATTPSPTSSPTPTPSPSPSPSHTFTSIEQPVRRSCRIANQLKPK